jgi:hypothetical protein
MNARLPRRTATLFALSVLAPLAASTAVAEESGRLTAEQVRSTFIGREWSQGSGTFLFAPDGTYRYDEPRMSARGTWRMDESGVLCTINTASGVRTCYTFYRQGDGYRYWHDRSRRFWPAQLR